MSIVYYMLHSYFTLNYSENLGFWAYFPNLIALSPANSHQAQWFWQRVKNLWRFLGFLTWEHSRENCVIDEKRCTLMTSSLYEFCLLYAPHLACIKLFWKPCLLSLFSQFNSIFTCKFSLNSAVLTASQKSLRRFSGFLAWERSRGRCGRSRPQQRDHSRKESGAGQAVGTCNSKSVTLVNPGVCAWTNLSWQHKTCAKF